MHLARPWLDPVGRMRAGPDGRALLLGDSLYGTGPGDSATRNCALTCLFSIMRKVSHDLLVTSFCLCR